MSKDYTPDMMRVDTFVRDTLDDSGLMPYHIIHEEVTSAISSMNNPIDLTGEQIDTILTDNGVGPYDAPEW